MLLPTEYPTESQDLQASRMRYQYMIPYVIGQDVIDFGSGSGLGTALLARYAKSIVGYEINPTALEMARKTYPQFIFTNFIAFDRKKVVVMSEVLEHLEVDTVDPLLASMQNCDLIISTPSGNLFPYHPQNIVERRGYHKWHYTVDELKTLLLRHFHYVIISMIVWDPAISTMTGLLAYASNQIEWQDKWFDEALL